MDITSNTKTVTTYTIELTRDELIDVESGLYILKNSNSHALWPLFEEMLAKVTYTLSTVPESDGFNL